MKKWKIFIGLFLVLSLFTGCDCKDEELRKTLGNNQYKGMDPQFSFEIDNEEIIVTTSEYRNDYKFKCKINTEQNNKAFPTNQDVSLSIHGDILNEQGKVIKDTTLYMTIKNGNGVKEIEDEIYFSDNEQVNIENHEKVQFRISSYSWRFEQVFQPYNGNDK